MKCCRFFVLFVAILIPIEGYDAGSPSFTSPKHKKVKTYPATPGQSANTATRQPITETASNPSANPISKPLPKFVLSETIDDVPGQSEKAYRSEAGGFPEEGYHTPGSSPRKKGSPNSKIPVRINKGQTGNNVPGQSKEAYQPSAGRSPMKVDNTPGSSARNGGSPNSKIPVRINKGPSTPREESTISGSSSKQTAKSRVCRRLYPKSPLPTPAGQKHSPEPGTSGNGVVPNRSPGTPGRNLYTQKTDPIVLREIKNRATGHQKECKGGKLYEIGYYEKRESMEGERRFVNVFEVCHNSDLRHTIYSHARILPGKKADDTKGGRSFLSLRIYRGLRINQIYTLKEEQKTIGKILGSIELGTEKINGDTNDGDYLARGHLTAKNDVIGTNEQRATNTYINVVPMWQKINNGKWRTMETRVRKINEKADFDLDVWTGSLGILTLEDVKGDKKEIYLYVKDDIRKIPVPEILFKVVYNRDAKSGIVLIVHNNPFVELEPDSEICTNVCQDNKWFDVKGKREPKRLPLSYCCTVNEFREAIQRFNVDIPEFPTVNLLKAPLE